MITSMWKDAGWTMSGKALHRLFGSKLVSRVQLPQNRWVLGFAPLLCADAFQGCTESYLEASRLSAVHRVFVCRQMSRLEQEGTWASVSSGTPTPGWSWGAAS